MTVPGVWHIVTGEYPPDPGGVSDYTRVVAAGLEAAGTDVHVLAPGTPSGLGRGTDGVSVHRLPGWFGPAGLAAADRHLARFPRPRTLLVQYVPHGFGWKGMNLPFAAWLWGRRHAHGDDVRVMFHEFACPWVSRPLRHNVLAAVTRVMARLVARAATRAYLSTPLWEPWVRAAGGPRLPVTWLPVPSTVPADPPADAVAAARAALRSGDLTAPVVGHFGRYGSHVAGGLEPVVRALLAGRADVRLALLGTGGPEWTARLTADRPDWAGRVAAPGELPLDAVAAHLRACDVVVQPYPDGATTRRTTLMAALANGVPTVTTAGGHSEPFWATTDAVAVAPAGNADRIAAAAFGLLDDPDARRALGTRGRELYDREFAPARTVDALLARDRS